MAISRGLANDLAAFAKHRDQWIQDWLKPADRPANSVDKEEPSGPPVTSEQVLDNLRAMGKPEPSGPDSLTSAEHVKAAIEANPSLTFGLQGWALEARRKRMQE